MNGKIRVNAYCQEFFQRIWRLEWICLWIQGVACLMLSRRVWKMKASDEAGSWGLMQFSREKMGGSGNRRSCGLTRSHQMLRLTSVRLHGKERNLPFVLRRSDRPSHLELIQREFPARCLSLGRPRLGHRSPSIDDRSTCL